MSLLITVLSVRNKNKELLLTDGIEAETIEDNITEAQIEVFNAVAHLYDIDTITNSNLPVELETAIRKNAVGQTIIDEYPNDKDIVEIGKKYKSDAEKLIKNIVDGKRHLKNIAKQEKAGTIANSIVYAESSIDTSVDSFITNLKTWT